MNLEIWKNVATHSTYEVSSNGKVRNKYSKNVLAANKINKGYLGVKLYSNDMKEYKNFRIHRLVAIAFYT